MKKSLLLSATLLLAPTMAHAQETAPRESWTNEETVVITGRADSVTAPNASTATRTDTPVEKIPQSIQTLTRTLIEEQDLQDVSGALKNVSGVTPNGLMQLVLQPPLIRGFAANYYFDGTPTYQLPAGVGDAGTLINVERIEVAKGPTSTLYGGGAGAPLSGIINLVSRDPGPALRATFGLRAGSFQTIGGDADINVPLADGLGFRVTGMIESADSFIDVINSDRYALFPTLKWDISPDTTLSVRGRYNRLEQQEYAGIPAEHVLAPSLPINPYVFAGATDAPRTMFETSQVTASLSHRFSSVVKGDVAVSHFHSSYAEWSTFPYGQIAGTLYNFGNGFLPSDTEKTFATASLTAKLGGPNIRHTLLGGVDYDKTDYFGAMYFNPFWASIDYTAADPTAPFGATPPLYFDQNDDLSSIAVFAQDQIGIGDKLDVTLGLRWTKLDIDSLISASGFPYPSKVDDARVTPRVGATYKVTDGVSLFAGYAEGFQGIVGGGFNGVDPVPETSQSYETGVKFAAPIKGLSGTLSLYQINRQNMLTPDPVLPGVYIQVGEQRAQGVEADLVYEPSSALSMLLSYAFTNAEVSKDNSLPVGDKLRAVPEHSLRLAGRYRFQGEALSGLEIGAGVTAVSARELTLPNTVAVDALTLADAQVAYDFGPATLSVSVTNLFDQGGFEPYQYFGGPYVIPTQPRSAFVTLRTKFGGGS